MRGIEKLRIAWRRLKLKIKEKELREKVPETYEIEKIIDKIKVRIHPHLFGTLVYEGKPLEYAYAVAYLAIKDEVTFRFIIVSEPALNGLSIETAMYAIFHEFFHLARITEEEKAEKKMAVVIGVNNEIKKGSEDFFDIYDIGDRWIEEGKPWVDVSKPILVINKLFEESKPVEI